MFYLLFSLFRRNFAAFWVHCQNSEVVEWAFCHQRTALKVKTAVLCSSAGPWILLVGIYKAPGQNDMPTLLVKSSHLGIWCFNCVNLPLTPCRSLQESIFKYSRTIPLIVLLFIWASRGFVALLLAAAVLANERLLTHRAAFPIIPCWKA